jgi:S-layer homology domain
VTVCQPREYLYALSSDQSTFTINYSVPFGRSIHTPHIYDVWTDTIDPAMAFYQLDYSEYVTDQNKYYLYRESAELSELCASEQAAFPQSRPCEHIISSGQTIYTDVTTLSDTMCLDLAKATTNTWVSGYSDGSYRPNNGMTRAEFSKLVA